MENLLSWRDSEWQRVIFSDESRFSLGGDTQRIRVRRHRGQHQDERFVITRPEGLVSLHLHPYRTICRNCVRMFKLHGMDYHRTPLGTSTAPYRDVWRGLRGATIVDSLDTLYIMGLTEDYQEAREWVRNNLDLNTPKLALGMVASVAPEHPAPLLSASLRGVSYEGSLEQLVYPLAGLSGYFRSVVTS
ncbi:hypothetical protein NFI96_001361 [Prochilodus magdalenae]|nr:hypothetical protein NFI96_001361 [Prochilodus magdalenae]